MSKIDLEERACKIAQYIVEESATVRAAAKKFSLSKSTVHKDMSERLKTCNNMLYAQVRQVLQENKADRHNRGGKATAEKYGAISKK